MMSGASRGVFVIDSAREVEVVLVWKVDANKLKRTVNKVNNIATVKPPVSTRIPGWLTMKEKLIVEQLDKSARHSRNLQVQNHPAHQDYRKTNFRIHNQPIKVQRSHHATI
jgi:hypothetical protein